MEAQQTKDERAVHLVVLQHGLWGRPDDVARLAAFLQAAFEAADAREQLQDRVAVKNSTCNLRVLTYDGIDVCGARLAKFVQETVEQQQQEGAKVVKLSLIGYSLGGLICRYAAGKLYVAGLFEEVAPVNLITIATPHLGSFKEPTSWLARFFNSNVPIVASRTGGQLLLADADYSMPWLEHQQQLHNQAHQQYAQQHAHQQRHAAEAPADSSSKQQQQQQQEETATGANAGGSSILYHPHQQQHAAEAPADSRSQQQQQEEAAVGDAAAAANAGGGSTSQQQQQQQRMRQQRISLPPGLDPSQPVPLLLLMAHPAGPFHKALAGFKTRICCANIRYDTTVPYCTAAICTANPYEQRPPVSINPQLYPSVVMPAGEAEQGAAFPDAKGRSRLLLFLLFLPLFPLFYGYSVAKGLLHHREARKKPLDVAWLQQYRAAAEASIRRLTASGALHEHEGIVEADGERDEQAWLLQQQQRWMAQQLFDVLPPCSVCERQWGIAGIDAAGTGRGYGVCGSPNPLLRFVGADDAAEDVVQQALEVLGTRLSLQRQNCDDELLDPGYSSHEEEEADSDDADGSPLSYCAKAKKTVKQPKKQGSQPAHNGSAAQGSSASPGSSKQQQQQQQACNDAARLLGGCTSSSPCQSSHGVTLEMLRKVYDLPISKAASSLGVGVTVLKRICRDMHISRWPYRKRQSLHKLMATVQAYGCSSGQPQAAQSVCQQLQAFLDELLEDPDREMEARIKKLRQATFKQEYKSRHGRHAAAAAAAAGQSAADDADTDSEADMLED
ncbi:hypothetical protein OEZ85_002042 [Tetradesmus obliquus]|uniref:RWP-RK domain-containing protein n=1 Tax=Tetradesmus obliquus TaxID=3088 RepID=A0ABY8U2D4_TETOB|nr:hypothetical protein OEZ85_002042 [Tetradesmus obliquus]